MKLLLDTHALLWFAAGDEMLSARAVNAICDVENDVFVSAVNALEISTKFRIGKLPGAELLATNFVQETEALNLTGLPIEVETARLAGAMRHAHRDPFDRLLIAQALTGDYIIVSNEQVFDEFGVKRLW
jgi:PIN domain nuclease of toxin-antitoxin system